LPNETSYLTLKLTAMKNFKIKDLMVTIYAGEQPHVHLMADEATCVAPSKCGQTKPDCMAVSRCSQTKPNCMALSSCGQTKPVKHYDDNYAAQLWALKQTIAGMQAK
jgi:hypothetical protein